MAYEVLERAVDQNVAEIDVDFVLSTDEANPAEQRQVSGIFQATKDLMKKSEKRKSFEESKFMPVVSP